MGSTVLALSAVVDLIAPVAEEAVDVSYPILQSVLHVLVQELGLAHSKLEFRGTDSDRIQDLVRRNQGKGTEVKTVLETVGKEEDSEKLLSDLHADLSKDKKSLEGEASYVLESGQMTVMEKKKAHQVTITSFSRLEGKVKSLQAQVESLGIQVLPSDEELLSKTRSGDQVTPISDLWQAMNITKRMSGAEEGIDKLASLLETVAKEYADLKLLLDKMQDELGLDVVETMKEIKLAADYAKKMRPRAQLYDKALAKREKSLKAVSSGVEAEGGEAAPDAGSIMDTDSVNEGSESSPASQPELPVQDEMVDTMSISTDGVSETCERDYERFAMLPDTNAEAVKINNLTMDQELIRRQMEFMTAQINTLADFSEKILPEILEGLPGMEELKKKIAAIRGKTGSQVTLSSADWEMKRATISMEQRVEDLESRVASHSSKLRRQDALFCDKYDTVLNRIREMQASITSIRVKFNLDDSSTEQNLFDPQNIKMLMEKNNIVNDEITDLYQEMSHLKSEINKQQHDFAGVLEEIDGIHSTKVDRFEIDDILADKADCSEVQCKVSTDIFEEFCNSLTKGVDFAIKSSVEQEKQWHKEMERMIDEMEKKFNVSDVAPLKEELEKKIEEVKTRLDQVARIKTYTMAAGSKRRLYTEVNCVACDKKAAMETVEERMSADKTATALKPYLNAKPYISVELDQLRKMRLKTPGAKNMQLHEQIMKNYAISVGFDLLPEHEVSFVNRYCGGAETLVNPRQRVAKVTKSLKCQNTTSR